MLRSNHASVIFSNKSLMRCSGSASGKLLRAPAMTASPFMMPVMCQQAMRCNSEDRWTRTVDVGWSYCFGSLLSSSCPS